MEEGELPYSPPPFPPSTVHWSASESTADAVVISLCEGYGFGEAVPTVLQELRKAMVAKKGARTVAASRTKVPT